MHFVKLGPKRKWHYWISPVHHKRVQNRKLNFSIAAHLPSSWRIWWRSARWSYRYQSINQRNFYSAPYKTWTAALDNV